MGKKSRVKAARQLEKESLNAKLAEQKKEKQKNTKITVTVTVAALLVIAVILGTVSAITGSGVLLRGKVSLSTENIEVDNAMLSYFFYNNFYNYLSTNSTQALQSGLNTTISLKNQDFSKELTWFDYIMNRAIDEVSSSLVLASAAKSEGITLNEEDRARVDAVIENLENNAKEAGVSTKKYIWANYGRGVNEDDIRRAIELVILAEKKSAAIADSLSFTDEQIEKYFEENKDSFTYVDYRAFEISADDYFAEDAIPENAGTVLSEIASKIGAATGEADFDAKIKEYLAESYKNKGKELTDEAVTNVLENTVVTSAVKGEDSLSKWAFDADRKVGDTVVISSEDKQDHTVYFLTATSYRPEYTTKNVRQILFATGNYENEEAAKAEAEKILAEWKAGEATEASFEALANEHSEGLNPLYENLSKDSGLAEFDEWIYDSSRKSTDVEIIKTYYGYHIMYFVGDGDVAWQAEVEGVMTGEAFTKAIEEYQDTYAVTYNEKNYNGVPGKNPSI